MTLFFLKLDPNVFMSASECGNEHRIALTRTVIADRALCVLDVLGSATGRPGLHS